MTKATAKELEKLGDELRWISARERTGDKVKAAAAKLLERAVTMPYAGYEGAREQAEELAIERLERASRADGKRLWLRVVQDWTAASPIAGQQRWRALAKLQGSLGAKLPAKLRTSARKAWATGRLCNVYTPRKGTTRAQAPKVPARALEQACVEIGLRQFDRARACAQSAKRKWPEAELLELVICMHERKPADALASLRVLASARAKSARYEHWETICAGLVLLDDPDAALSARCLAAWKRSEHDAPTTLYES